MVYYLRLIIILANAFLAFLGIFLLIDELQHISNNFDETVLVMPLLSITSIFSSLFVFATFHYAGTHHESRNILDGAMVQMKSTSKKPPLILGILNFIHGLYIIGLIVVLLIIIFTDNYFDISMIYDNLQAYIILVATTAVGVLIMWYSVYIYTKKAPLKSE